MLLIGAIADDLTGATDLALTLAREGMAVVQTVGVPDESTEFGDAEAVVVSLKSRTIPAAEAVAMSLASADRLLAGGARQLFFKYCSTFDSTDAGNIGPVADALLERLGATRTIACPAFPANMRTIYKGYLFVGDVLLSESSMRDHPLTPMRDPSLVRVLGRQTPRGVSLIEHRTVANGADAIKASLDALDGYAIVDAITDADLRAIGAACRDLKLVTGGSGVAMGLPANFPDRRSTGAPTRLTGAAPGRRVVLAGSCSQATRGQVDHALDAGLPALRLDPIDIAEGRLTPDIALAFALGTPDDTIPLLYSTAEPAAVAAAQAQLGRDAAGAMIEDFLARAATGLAQSGVTRFLVAGGETSGAVVGALGVRALEIGPEIDPGVPWTLSRGTAQPLALALKSGNFGTPDFFTKAWSLLD